MNGFNDERVFERYDKGMFEWSGLIYHLPVSPKENMAVHKEFNAALFGFIKCRLSISVISQFVRAFSRGDEWNF